MDHSNLPSPYWIPNVSNSLHHDHITTALNLSPDNGETLVFSKLDLTDIGVDALEELATRIDHNSEGTVKRIALGNNRLTTLPTELALLTRLRYLNLRHNSFSSFPRVLTLIQSLDTLDISHNKIRRLPNEPGSLVNLRVFCLSRNKISRLPTYLAQFHKLEVLRVDRNPVEWPPKAIMELPGSNDLSLMREWIQNVQNWIETESSRGQSEDVLYHDGDSFDRNINESWRFPTQHNGHSDELGYHRRSYSVDSNTSLSSISESLHEVSSPEVPSVNQPPPLHLGILQPTSPDPSPTRSLASETSPTFDYGVKVPETFEQMQNFELLPPHTRTASYAEGVKPLFATAISMKKSLPNLRNIHVLLPSATPTPPTSHRGFGFSSSQAQEDTFHHSSSSFPPRLGPTTPTPPSEISNPSQETLPDDGMLSVATERNSYFRRLSAFPPSTSLPQHLISLVECSRSFLFAMCQIYQSLEQYAALVIDDRFSVVLRKVLEPAHSDMIQFIQALELFDSASRTSLPTPLVCRSLLEKCRDCAAAFGKAVNVLILRLRVDPGEDMRFSRWLLLEMYAAMAEISSAWISMQGHVDNLKSYLQARDNTIPSHFPENITTLEVPPHNLRAGIPVRKKTSRRHAGSFSSKDVEIGKKLPSYEIPPALTGGVLSGPAPHVPTLRTPKRQATAPILSSAPRISSPSPFLGQNSSTEEWPKFHVRQTSQRSNPNFSPSSSPSLTAKGLNLELASSSKRKVDFEALNAIQHAVEAAPRVWNMVAETLSANSAQDTQEVQTVLEEAQTATRKLSEIINRISNGDSTPEKKALQEDAQNFAQVVVKISSLVKAHSVQHSVPSSLRSSIVKLTNLTEEFAILLHVSSFAPSTPRSFSPMLVNSTNFGRDGRLTSNLSRARSAHSPIVKIPHPALNDGSRSALPTQSFKIPEINLNRRLREARDAQLDAPEPG